MFPAHAALHADCAALGTRLFTISVVDTRAALTRRAYTSHPAQYPTDGTKPMLHDGWYDHCIAGQQTFVANTAPAFARYFFDHALITSMGLGSCINVPLIHDGAVLATVNLLAEDHHFTPDRLTAYHTVIARHHAALVRTLTP